MRSSSRSILIGVSSAIAPMAFFDCTDPHFWALAISINLLGLALRPDL